jgi:hypothetical protein
VDGKREPNPKLGSMPLYSLDTIAWMEIFTEMGFYKSGIGVDNTWEHTKDSELLVNLKIKGTGITLKVWHSKRGGTSKMVCLERTQSVSFGIDVLLTEIRNIYRS